MKKYLLLSAMFGMIVSNVIAEESKKASPATPASTTMTEPMKMEAKKPAPAKSVIKKARKKIKKVQ